MAEFQEVIQQNKRMCQSIRCYKCDIYRLCGEDLSKCQQFINNNPKKAEEVIMSWAAEHPEPVYPTFAEWLCSIGVTISDRPFPAPNIPVYVFQVNAKMFEPIPADIAQKLGIEPLPKA